MFPFFAFSVSTSAGPGGGSSRALAPDACAARTRAQSFTVFTAAQRRPRPVCVRYGLIYPLFRSK